VVANRLQASPEPAAQERWQLLRGRPLPDKWVLEISETAFRPPAPRTTAATLRSSPTRCVRRLQPLDPLVVELRECSRLLEDLRHDRNRLANRVLELLWRDFPAMLELDDDDCRAAIRS